MDCKSSQKKNIIFITDKWGPVHGGINSFNTDFCKALAEIVREDYQVVCAVEEASEENERDAGDVRLLTIDGKLDKNCIRIIHDIIREENGEIVLCAGHDYISGHITNEAKKLYDKKSVVFQHMAPWLYQAYKSLSGNKAHDKDMEQRVIAEECDHIFAVGPLLYDHASVLCDDANKVTMLIPGLQEKKRKRYSKNRFNGITFGRLNKEDDRIKQGLLAARAFFKAVDNFPPEIHVKPIFTLLGLSKEEPEYKKELNKLMKSFKKETKGRVILNALSYLEDENEIDTRLLEQNLCIMLSWHEGFGLVGWEAIAAAIPLIVATDSGLYQFIDEHHHELTSYLYSVSSRGEENEIMEEVSNKIKLIMMQKENACEYAEKLRDGLKDYTWKLAVEKFAKVCGIPLKTEIRSVKSENKDKSKTLKVQDIDGRVESEIRKMLENGKFVQLTEAIYDELSGDRKTGKDVDKVGVVTRYLIDSPSHFDILITLHKAVKRCFDDIAETSEKEIFKYALDIFGWLIIRHVDTDWVEENRAAIFDSRKTPSIELPVATHVGAEILTSRIKGAKAGFVKASSDTIMGEHSLLKKRVIVHEFGWDDDDKVFSFKKMLWKLVFKEEFPAGNKFEKKSNEKLNGKLKFMFTSGIFYFPINLEADDEKLINFIKDGNCYAKLKNDLPDFKLVIINIGGKKSPLLINDNELEGELLGFFELEPK